ncbi:hypothetical protein HY480_01770 [Candidatus Uhrbacteria bacterium]|nr:hypothetical protein [Candidatus Uhrbacteria bacterium]
MGAKFLAALAMIGALAWLDIVWWHVLPLRFGRLFAVGVTAAVAVFTWWVARESAAPEKPRCPRCNSSMNKFVVLLPNVDDVLRCPRCGYEGRVPQAQSEHSCDA